MPAVRPARERQRQVDRLPLRQLAVRVDDLREPRVDVDPGRLRAHRLRQREQARQLRIDALDLREDHAQRVLLPPAIAGQRVFRLQPHRAHRIANLVRDLRGQLAQHAEAFGLREARAQFVGLLLQPVRAPRPLVERIDDAVEIGPPTYGR